MYVVRGSTKATLLVGCIYLRSAANGFCIPPHSQNWRIQLAVRPRHSHLSLWSYDFGCATVPGTDPDRPQKVNQDGYFTMRGEILEQHLQTPQAPATRTDECTNACMISGVLDGHGLKGHEVVQFLQHQLPACISTELRLQQNSAPKTNTTEDANIHEQMNKQRDDLLQLGKANLNEMQAADLDNDTVSQALVSAFLAAHLYAKTNSSVPASRSGTTCVVNLVSATTSGHLILYSATVGDSHGLWITSHGIDDIPWTVQRITTATTVSIPSERDRLERCEGRIDGNGNVFYGPVGIAMTRSLGNTVMLRAGVLPIPVVTRYNLTHNHPNDSTNCPTHFVCAGSDGVFDVLSDATILQIIKTSLDASHKVSLQDVAQEVCHQARLGWLAGLPIETKVDDATFVILQCSGDRAIAHGQI